MHEGATKNNAFYVIFCHMEKYHLTASEKTLQDRNSLFTIPRRSLKVYTGVWKHMPGKSRRQISLLSPANEKADEVW